MSQEDVAVRLRDVTTGYRGATVLDGIDMTIQAGTVVGVVGPNGAGKTTLLRAITGILPLYRGAVIIRGRHLQSLSRRDLAQSVAVVPQTSTLIFDFTVREVVSMGRLPHQSVWAGESARDRSMVDRALRITEMADLAERSYPDLSGGEQRRALFARALAQDPYILLLDEPTSHLDPGQGRGLMERARGMAVEEGMAVLTILHDLNMAALYCDVVIIVKEGRIWDRGRPAEVFNGSSLSEVYDLPVAVVRHPVTGDPQVLINPSEPSRGKDRIRAARVSG
ncbi:MAG: heme ABC transporter ATP-binding protein [Bacillota bacterium]